MDTNKIQQALVKLTDPKVSEGLQTAATLLGHPEASANIQKLSFLGQLLFDLFGELFQSHAPTVGARKESDIVVPTGEVAQTYSGGDSI